MAKGTSSLRNNKSRSSKPYDASNSFVRKVTAQVSNLLPQPEWLTRWFSSSTSKENDVESDDETEVVEAPQQPPSKRAKISLNRTFPASSFTVADDDLRDRRPAFTSPSPVRHAYPDAVAGPSGLSSSARFSSSATLQSTMVTENVETKINGDGGGSDSSESTSGCSSLIPQASKQTSGESLAARRRCIDEKLNLTNHLQSPRTLFPNRTKTPRLLPPPNRRRPSFNSSVFSSPLQERDKLPCKELSPFYSGRTMYGGASAYRRPRDSLFVSELNMSKRGIQVRPVNEAKDSPEASMSHTARRILEALEQFSTPIQDAKRMPLNAPLYRPPLGSKRKCVDNGTPPPAPPLPTTPLRSGPPTQSLTVPTVADLIKLRTKEKLQDSMESARRIASISAEPYSLRQNEDKKRVRHHGKILKGACIDDDEVIPQVNLPEVALPITTMPKFDIIVPPVVSSAVSPPQSNSFKFSSPIIVTSKAHDVKAQGKFVFSQPISKSAEETVAAVSQNFIPTCPSLLQSEDGFRKKELKTKTKEQKISVVNEIKPANELKTGSVMDILMPQKKEGEKSGGSVGFGAAFKPAAGTWECDVCMIRNKADADLCMACETPRETKAVPPVKSDSTRKCTSCSVSVKSHETLCTACASAKPGKEEPTWICAACGDKNLASATTCKDCWCNKPEPSKTSTSKTSTWTCSVCSVQNNEGNATCTACKKSRSSSPSSSSKTQFSFKIPPEAGTYKFGIDKSGTAPPEGNNLGGFKFGKTAVTNLNMNFSFGVPSSKVSQESSKVKEVPVITTPATSAVTKPDGPKDTNIARPEACKTPSVVDKTPILDTKGSSGSDSVRKRKSESADLEVKESVSAQKWKVGSSERAKSEDKSAQSGKSSSNSAKSSTAMFNSSDGLKSTPGIPNFVSTTVSSSGLNASAPVTTKTTGFSFVSSTSVDKPPAVAPHFVFGSSSSKAESVSVVAKPTSLFGPPATTAPTVSGFGSSATSSSASQPTVPGAPATISNTFMFGAGTAKPLFGTATNMTTSVSTSSFSSPTTKMSFAAPVTTAPNFGVPDTTTPAFGSSAAGKQSPTLNFGSNSPAKAAQLFTTNTAATTAPSFGSTTQSFAPTSTTATGGLSSVPSTNPPPFSATTTTTTTTVAFGSTSSATPTFGSTSTATPNFGSIPAAKVSGFGSTPATTAAPMFGSTPSSTPAFASATTKLTSSFGSTPVTTPSFGGTPAPNFGITPPSTTPSFGSVSTAATPAFGTPVTSASTFVVPAKPSNFGSNAPAASFGISSPKTPAFGSQSVTSAFGTPSATPAFGNSAGSAVNFGTPAFGTPATTVGFGTPTATPSFGTSKTESNFAATPAPAPIFGTATTSSGFGSGFGTTSTPAFGGFSSGTGKSTASNSASGAFVFKGNAAPSIFGGNQPTSNNSDCPPAKAPNFGFGSANTGTANSTPAAATPAFGTFNFSSGSAAAAAAPTPGPSVFGANTGGTNAPVFGSGTAPAFGVASTSGGFGSSGGFNFNASSAGSQPFTFTGAQSSQNTTPGFGQMQQPQPTPPTFNPNVRPSFDFTGGETPQFTAQSTSSPQVAAGRRFKKALRRNVR